MTRNNRRFDDDAPPGGYNRPTHPNLDLDGVDPEAYRIIRVPDHPSLARIRYQYDAIFAEAINVAYKWLDRADAPDDVFAEYPGRRLKITRNLLGEEYYGGDVEPFVAVVTDDERVDALLDWADETPSAYAERDTPEWLTLAGRTHIDEAKVEAAIDGDVDDLTSFARATIDHARERYEEGEVTRAEFYALVADMVDADPVEAPSSDAEPGGSDAEDRFEMSWRDVAVGTAIFVAVLILIAGAIYVFV